MDKEENNLFDKTQWVKTFDKETAITQSLNQTSQFFKGAVAAVKEIGIKETDNTFATLVDMYIKMAESAYASALHVHMSEK